jgi:phosphate starvation-inducible PhoH-like protein
LPREAEPPSSIRIEFPDVDKLRLLCGAHQENLKIVERRTGVQLGARGSQIVVAGGDAAARELADRVVRALYELVDNGYPLYLEDVDQAAKLVAQGQSPREIFGDTIYVTARHRIITPKNLGQRRYVQAIRDHDIVFGIGPAGTGKTYLAMAMAR